MGSILIFIFYHCVFKSLRGREHVLRCLGTFSLTGARFLRGCSGSPSATLPSPPLPLHCICAVFVLGFGNVTLCSL